MNTRDRRKAAGVSLNELATVLGKGFSPARLSLAERGFVRFSEAESTVVAAAIDKLGALRAEAREIVERASRIDFVAHCQDIHQRAQSLHAVS
jgi:transcriptional regulator with XRE-family HTH domain